jgi:hypothetical protein
VRCFPNCLCISLNAIQNPGPDRPGIRFLQANPRILGLQKREKCTNSQGFWKRLLCPKGKVRKFRSSLPIQAGTSRHVEFHSEFLDVSRFSKEAQQENQRDLNQFFHNINDLRVILIVPPKAPRTDGAYVASEPLWRIWNPSWGLAALVRPNDHVGWMERRPTLAQLDGGVRKALGSIPREVPQNSFTH